jgi:hypothetical protein
MTSDAKYIGAAENKTKNVMQPEESKHAHEFCFRQPTVGVP